DPARVPMTVVGPAETRERRHQQPQLSPAVTFDENLHERLARPAPARQVSIERRIPGRDPRPGALAIEVPHRAAAPPAPRGGEKLLEGLVRGRRRDRGRARCAPPAFSSWADVRG